MGKETPHIPRSSGHGQVPGVDGATDFSSRLTFPLHITVYILLTCFQLLITEPLSQFWPPLLTRLLCTNSWKNRPTPRSLDSLTSHVLV